MNGRIALLYEPARTLFLFDCFDNIALEGRVGSLRANGFAGGRDLLLISGPAPALPWAVPAVTRLQIHKFR